MISVISPAAAVAGSGVNSLDLRVRYLSNILQSVSQHFICVKEEIRTSFLTIR